MNNSQKGIVYLIPSFLAPNTTDKSVVPAVYELIQSIDYYLVENIRTARRFISSLKTGKNIESIVFEVLDKNTQESDIEELILPIWDGKDIGVISEAGCPGIADPGAAIVSYAHKKNIKVVPIVGPSSIFLALMASGLNGQKFAFKGYLPIENLARIKAIQEMEKQALIETQIFMETPYRNNQLFEAILKSANSETIMCIACTITGVDEFIQTCSIKQWKTRTVNLHKKPTIFLFGNRS